MSIIDEGFSIGIGSGRIDRLPCAVIGHTVIFRFLAFGNLHSSNVFPDVVQIEAAGSRLLSHGGQHDSPIELPRIWQARLEMTGRDKELVVNYLGSAGVQGSETIPISGRAPAGAPVHLGDGLSVNVGTVTAHGTVNALPVVISGPNASDWRDLSSLVVRQSGVPLTLANAAMGASDGLAFWTLLFLSRVAPDPSVTVEVDGVVLS